MNNHVNNEIGDEFWAEQLFSRTVGGGEGVPARDPSRVYTKRLRTKKRDLRLASLSYAGPSGDLAVQSAMAHRRVASEYNLFAHGGSTA